MSTGGIFSHEAKLFVLLMLYVGWRTILVDDEVEIVICCTDLKLEAFLLLASSAKLCVVNLLLSQPTAEPFILVKTL